MSFLRALAWSEMQTTSSGIWTRDAYSIFWTHLHVCLYVCMCKHCTNIYIYIYIYIYISWPTVVDGRPKGFFFDSYYTDSLDSLNWYTSLDSCLIILSAKQGGFKYNFLSIWYDSTWDWTPVSQTIGKNLTTMPMTQYNIYNTYNYICICQRV